MITLPLGIVQQALDCVNYRINHTKEGDFAKLETLHITLDTAIQNAHQLDAGQTYTLEVIKNDLLIALIRRMGGAVDMPAAELDAVGGVGLRVEALLDPVTGKPSTMLRFSTVEKP